jgi:leader peptidase (prepilin peptidase)/N-methyltransferase
MIFDILVLLYGLIIGSFLNVLVYRLPLEKSLLKPLRSICTNCKTQIKWYENIPIISYIFLRARCSTCQEKISIIYPLVEILTAFVTLLLVNKLGLNIDTFIILFLFYTLIVLSFIDFKYKAVPDYLLLIALLSAFFVPDFSFQYALIFAGGFVLLDFILTFYIQNIKAKIVQNDDLRYQTALGEGDIPIVAIIGGLLGLKLSVLAFFIAALSALIPSIYIMMKKNDIETPFIPFLLLGLFISYIYGTSILLFLGISI